MGAFWGLWLAQELPADVAAVVLFYGTGDGNYSQIRAAFLGHFAETDEFEDPAVVQDLEKVLRTTSGKDVTFNIYPGTKHWFFEKDRPDAYDASAAELAWQRTIRFLKTQLSGRPGAAEIQDLPGRYFVRKTPPLKTRCPFPPVCGWYEIEAIPFLLI